MNRFKKYVQYLKNCGGSISNDKFREDWEPIGGQIMCEMVTAGIAGQNDFNIWLKEKRSEA